MSSMKEKKIILNLSYRLESSLLILFLFLFFSASCPPQEDNVLISTPDAKEETA